MILSKPRTSIILTVKKVIPFNIKHFYNIFIIRHSGNNGVPFFIYDLFTLEVIKKSVNYGNKTEEFSILKNKKYKNGEFKNLLRF